MITKEAQFSKYKAYYPVDGTRFMALTILDANRYAKKVGVELEIEKWIDEERK